MCIPAPFASFARSGLTEMLAELRLPFFFPRDTVKEVLAGFASSIPRFPFFNPSF
jgi:hypothetical protein